MPTRSLIKRNGFIVGGGGGGTHSAEEGQNPLAEHVPPDRIRWRILSPWTVPASGLCPPGQNPLADCVRGDTFWGGDKIRYDTGVSEGGDSGQARYDNWGGWGGVRCCPLQTQYEKRGPFNSLAQGLLYLNTLSLLPVTILAEKGEAPGAPSLGSGFGYI